MSEYTEQKAALEKRKCKKCNGIGTLMVRFEYEPCPACNETGFAIDKFAKFKELFAVDIKEMQLVIEDHCPMGIFEELEVLIKSAFVSGQEAGK